MAPTQDKVQLGCGSIIIIALIVILFARSGDKVEMQRLNDKMDALQKKIELLEARPVLTSSELRPSFERIDQKLDFITEWLKMRAGANNSAP